MIGRLFGIEKEIDKLEPEEKARIRQERSKPVVEEFFKWCEKNLTLVSNGSKIAKAIGYAQNHKKGLSEYLNDGLLPMTNSLDERTIRPFTTGRKTGCFQRAQKRAEASAAVYSIIETAKGME